MRKDAATPATAQLRKLFHKLFHTPSSSTPFRPHVKGNSGHVAPRDSDRAIPPALRFIPPLTPFLLQSFLVLASHPFTRSPLSPKPSFAFLFLKTPTRGCRRSCAVRRNGMRFRKATPTRASTTSFNPSFYSSFINRLERRRSDGTLPDAHASALNWKTV